MLDLIDKEEIIEVEEKINKALKKELEQRQIAKEKKEKEDDFTESDAKFNLKDNAEDLEKKPVETKKVSFNRR